MRTSSTVCFAFLAAFIPVSQAQTEVITNTKMPWDMTVDEIADVTCTSYRNRALASYSAFGDQIPPVSCPKFDEFKSEEDRIFDPTNGSEKERRATFDALYSKPDYLPYKMRESLGGMLNSAKDYDVLATNSVQKATGALIASHIVAAHLPSMQKYVEDLLEAQHPSNYLAMQQSITAMTDSTLKYENCLTLYILKAAK